MDASKPRHHDLPPDLLAEIDAIAAAEHRPSGEVLREAVELYLRDRLSASALKRSPLEAAARMRESRETRPLPEGTSIRDFIVQGRA